MIYGGDAEVWNQIGRVIDCDESGCTVIIGTLKGDSARKTCTGDRVLLVVRERRGWHWERGRRWRCSEAPDDQTYR